MEFQLISMSCRLLCRTVVVFITQNDGGNGQRWTQTATMREKYRTSRNAARDQTNKDTNQIAADDAEIHS